MDDDSSEVDQNPLFALIEIRRQAERLAMAQVAENPDFELLIHRKEQEIAIAKTAVADLKEKISVDQKQSEHTIAVLQSTVEGKEKELNKARKEIASLSEENKRLAEELSKCHKALADVVNDTQEMSKKHNQELADTRLKYEQEMYILKKLSR